MVQVLAAVVRVQFEIHWIEIALREIDRRPMRSVEYENQKQ